MLPERVNDASQWPTMVSSHEKNRFRTGRPRHQLKALPLHPVGNVEPIDLGRSERGLVESTACAPLRTESHGANEERKEPISAASKIIALSPGEEISKQQ
jgi:hypothetical protein